MEHIKITLSPDEYEGLARICESELRSIADQVRFLIRRELERRKHESQPAYKEEQ